LTRVLALDHGAARCGVAISDPTGTIVTPLDPVLRPDTKKGMAALAALVGEREAERVVVGLPLSLSGEDSDQTRAAREFAEKLAARIRPVPVDLYDERFTEDSRAAAVLLESWLSREGRT
jgi:putative Holliday junction resolvase